MEVKYAQLKQGNMHCTFVDHIDKRDTENTETTRKSILMIGQRQTERYDASGSMKLT